MSVQKQFGQLVGMLVQNLPEDLTPAQMQAWIGNPKGLQVGLRFLVQHVIIDCDADPFLPQGWKVESHKKMGQFEWDATKVALYLDEGQQGGKCIEGNKLRKKLEAKNVHNANVLDYLLAHPELIPEEWKGKAVFFWGTVYRNSAGGLYVRYLYWDGKRWDWYCLWLDSSWGGNSPAACSQV